MRKNHENWMHMQQQKQPLKVFWKIDVTKLTVKAHISYPMNNFIFSKMVGSSLQFY